MVIVLDRRVPFQTAKSPISGGPPGALKPALRGPAPGSSPIYTMRSYERL